MDNVIYVNGDRFFLIQIITNRNKRETLFFVSFFSTLKYNNVGWLYRSDQSQPRTHEKFTMCISDWQ